MAYQTNIKAFLRDNSTIEVAVQKKYNTLELRTLRLYEDGKKVAKLDCVSKTESRSTFIYTFELNYELKVGSVYEMANEKNEYFPLDISVLARSSLFEFEYRSDEELGAIYSKDKTIFRVYSPLASSGVVKVILKGETEARYFVMHKSKGGLMEATVEMDLDEAQYIYIMNINGKFRSAVDPYAKSLTANSRMGYVIDVNRLNDIDLHEDCLPEFNSWTDACIYEIDVRDMTSLTDVKDKGTYKALYTEGNKDENGNPVGIDYISSLGISHVQLLPVFDFQTIDDEDPLSNYNWGYDPLFYFAPEGSYSTDPNDAYARVRELRTLVSSFHKRGIRVNMDVVFNHTFNRVSNSFEALCPDYYYRLNDDGSYSNGSFCGNDLETRNYMVRRLIIDSLVYFTKVYGMDGFRFDLMGIIDKVTIKKAYNTLKKIKPDIMFYGEGWDMPTNLSYQDKSSMANAFDLEDIAFFNDRYRDISKGKSDESNLHVRGYLNGDQNYRDGFKHVFLGSAISLAYPQLFKNVSQSINYLECHDNATLFDKLLVSNSCEDEKTLLKRIKLCNACNILAFGVPFIHAGQEVGLSKDGVSNSYNSGDYINGFKYDVAYQREDLIRYFRDCLKLKKFSRIFSLDDREEIIKKIDFEDLPNGALAIKYDDTDRSQKIVVIINPSMATVKYQFDKYYKIIFNEAGYIEGENYSQLVLVNGITLVAAVSSTQGSN